MQRNRIIGSISKDEKLLELLRAKEATLRGGGGLLIRQSHVIIEHQSPCKTKRDKK